MKCDFGIEITSSHMFHSIYTLLSQPATSWVVAISYYYASIYFMRSKQKAKKKYMNFETKVEGEFRNCTYSKETDVGSML